MEKKEPRQVGEIIRDLIIHGKILPTYKTEDHGKGKQ